jgi:hypothetical protein
MPPTYWRVPIALFAVTCFSPALAACQKGAKSLKFAGVGTIQASSIEGDDDGRVLQDACFDFSGWTFQSTELRLDPNGFDADQTTITSPGAKGSVETLSFSVDENTLNIQNLRFEFGSSFKLQGFPYTGQYVMQAESGTLSDFRFDLNNAIFDQTVTVGPLSVPARRIKAKRALLADNTATLVDMELAAPYLGFTIRGALSVEGNTQLGVTRSNIVIGRNRDADELGFTADRFTLDQEGTVRLENATFRAFGMNLFNLPEFEFDPLEPIPVVLGYGPGVTAGVNNLRIGPKRDGLRVTLIGHNVLDSTGSLQFGVTWTQPAFRLTVAQAKGITSPITALFSSRNTTGFTYGFALNLGRNLLDPGKPLGERAGEGANVGYALEQPTSLSVSGVSNTFKLRESLEVGQLWQEESAKPVQSEPRSLTQFVGYGLANLEASYLGSTNGLSWNTKAGINAVGYTPSNNQPYALFTSRFAFDAGINYSIPGVFSAGLTFAHRQPLANTYAYGYLTNGLTSALSVGLIRRLPVEDSTTLNFTTRLTTSTFLGIPPAGYAGLTLENPSAAITINSNLRNLAKAADKDFTVDKVLTVQKVELGFDISIYDGQTFIDTLDRPAAAPILTLSPFMKYDFAFTPGYQLGQYGLNFTVYTASLGFTLGTTYERRTKLGGNFSDSWSLNLGFRLR